MGCFKECDLLQFLNYDIIIIIIVIVIPIIVIIIIIAIVIMIMIMIIANIRDLNCRRPKLTMRGVNFFLARET